MSTEDILVVAVALSGTGAIYNFVRCFAHVARLKRMNETDTALAFALMFILIFITMTLLSVIDKSSTPAL